MIALDLFAGHGWGVACQRLGIEEYGVEIMPEARAIRAANGMRTAYADVWDGLLGDAEVPAAALQIASPPCQTFSMAGKGTGRTATADVLRLIDERAYLRPGDLRAFASEHEDDGIALVLTPLALVARHAPTYVVWEQVPPVLPVWERAAAEMREWGYSVWTGVLNAEQYGVPQTRRRAVLIARADGKEAAPPTPTHSRYYSRDPKRLDPGVLPWISMAEALGWSKDDEMRNNRRANAATRRGDEPAGTVYFGPRLNIVERVMRSNYGSGGDPAARGERAENAPAPTVTSKADRNMWTERRGDVDIDLPAVTLSGDPRVAQRKHHEPGSPQMQGSARVTVAEAAALQSYPADFVWGVMVDGPRGPKPITKTKQFLTIGNAVPPLMAEAILKAVLS